MRQNSKLETRNPREARIPNGQTPRAFYRFQHFGFRALGLFRVSDFGFRVSFLATLLLCLLVVQCALAEQRFPPPDFQSGYQLPVTTTPPARALWLQYADVAVLAGALGLATWLA
ncbi:MAG: hypothetical protein N2379_11260, partial [Verrucomicrobiae bacterium]|nr:hypothetical protein [Verrucomicrobiae bacterium]